jgi:hypothetical protein
MTPDHPEQLTADEVAVFPADALLDAIIDGRPCTVEDDLRFLLAGPFGVDWRAGRPPLEAPATSWEPTLLELGHAVPRPCTWTRCGASTASTTPEGRRCQPCADAAACWPPCSWAWSSPAPCSPPPSTDPSQGR